MTIKGAIQDFCNCGQHVLMMIMIMIVVVTIEGAIQDFTIVDNMS